VIVHFVLKNKNFVNFNSRNMVIFTEFLDFVMFGTRDLGHNSDFFFKLPKISINHHNYAVFHAENNLSKLQLSFFHFHSGLILTLRGPTSLNSGQP
jgi:hypothetical protein